MDHFWSSNPATNEDRSVAYQDKTISSSNVESKGCTAQQNVTSPVDSGHAKCGSHGNVANDRYIADQKMNEDDGWLSEKYAEQDHALKKSRRKQDTPARMSHHNEGETLSGSDLKLYSESGPVIPRYSGYSENFIDDEMALLEGTSDHEYCYDQQEDFVERLKKSRKLYKSNRVTSEDNSDGSESSSDEDNSEDMTNAIADIAAQLETDEEAGNDKGPSRKRKMKTFQCQLCLFSSKDSYALAIHMQTHLGKCPYSCRSCRESYRRRNGLKRHILRAHPEKVEELISCISEDYNLKLRDLFLSSVRYNNRSGLSDIQEHSDISTSEQNFTVSHNFTERNLSKKKPVGFVSPISNEGINTSQQMETLPPAGQETYVPANDHYARSTFGIKKKSKKQLYVVLRPIDLDTDFNHPSKDSERNDSLPNFSVEGVESPNNGSEKAHVDNYQRKNDVEWGPTPCDSNLDGLPPQLDEVIDNQKYSRAKSFTSESLSPPTLEPIEHCSKKSVQLMSFQYESKSIRDLSSKEFANPQPTITVGFAVAEDTQDPVTRTSQLSDTQDIASHENVNENQISDVIKLSSSSRSEDQSTCRYSVQNAGNGDSFADTNMNSNCGSVAAFAGDESDRRFKQCNNNISANASGKMETAVDIHSPEDGGKIMTQTESSEKTEFANEEKGLPSEDEKHGRLTSLSPKHNIDSSALNLRGDENVEGTETQSKPEYLVSLSPLKEKSDSLSSLETLSKLQSIAVRVDSASKETPEKVAKDLPSASHDDQGSMNQPASAQELAADGNLSLHQLLAKSRYIPEADNAKVDVKVKKPMSAKVSDIVRVAASIKQDIATHRHHMHTCREDLSDFKSEMEFLVRSKNFQIGSFSVTAKVRHISSGQIQVAYECPLCQHLFTSYKGLNFHYRRKHKNDSMEEAVRKEAQNIRSEEVLLPEGQFFLEGQPTQGHPHPMHMRPVSAALYLGRLAEVNRTIAEQNYQKGGSEHQAGHTTAEEDLRRHPTTPVSQVATAQHFHQNLLASPVVPMQPIHQQAEIVSGHRSFIPQANMPAGLPPNQHGKEVINPSHFQRTVNENNPVDLSKKADVQQYRRQESLQTVQTVTNENMTVIHTNRNIQTTSTQAVIQSSQGLQTLQKEPLMSPRPSQHQVQMLSGIVPQQAYPGTMHPPGHTNVKPISSATQNGDDQRGRNLISDMSQLPQGQCQRRHSTSMEQTSNTGIPNVSTGVSHHSGHHYSQVSLLHQTYDVVSPNRMRHPPASQFPASGSHQNTLSQDTQSVTTSAGQSVVVDLSLRQQNPQSVIHSDSPMAYTSTLVPQIQTQHAARDDVSAAKAQVSMSPWLPIPTTQPDEMYRQKLLKVPVLAQGQQPMLIYTQDQHASTSVNRVVGIEGNQTNQTSVNIHKMPNRSMEMLSLKTLGKETPVKHTVDLSVRPKPKFLTPAPGKPFSKTLFGRFIDTFNTPLSSGTKRMPPLKVPNPTVIQRPPSSQDLIPQVSRITTAATTVSSLHVQETQSTTPTLPVNQMFLNDPRRPVQMQLVPMPQCLPSQQAAQYMGMDMPSNSPGYAASANEPRVNQTITSSSQLTPKRGSFVPQPQLNLNLLRTPGQPRALMQAGCQPFQVDMGKEHGNQFRQPNLQRLHASTMPNVRMVYPPREAYGMHYPAMESRPDVSKVSEEISNMASLVNRLPPSKKPSQC
ncbi:uncharacterized protein [Ptychodera flava]|uniref:uncharacterized protein n=1 Tax=Ptychodera flava TaxID=63121 RepID=UPI00396A1525